MINTTQMVALKFIPKLGKSGPELQALQREITIMRALRHENIVALYDWLETDSEVTWYVAAKSRRCDYLSAHLHLKRWMAAAFIECNTVCDRACPAVCGAVHALQCSGAACGVVRVLQHAGQCVPCSVRGSACPAV